MKVSTSSAMKGIISDLTHFDSKLKGKIKQKKAAEAQN
jgi:hypothetical protein